MKSKENQKSTRKRAKEKESAGGVLKTIFFAIVIAIVVRTFLFEPFNIPSGSMLPGLRVGDYLFVSKYSYGYSRYSFPFSPSFFPDGRIPDGKPDRGDVAVFRLPSDTTVDYIKRVVGLPGDRIKVENGRLYINGTIVPREGPLNRADNADRASTGHDSAIGSECFNRATGVPFAARAYRQTLPNGKTFTIFECSDTEPDSDNTREFTVPAGHYFMMGDNRDNSIDSRFRRVGMVPAANLIGKAQFLFLSVNGKARIWEVWKWPEAIRWDRLFQGVR